MHSILGGIVLSFNLTAMVKIRISEFSGKSNSCPVVLATVVTVVIVIVVTVLIGTVVVVVIVTVLTLLIVRVGTLVFMRVGRVAVGGCPHIRSSAEGGSFVKKCQLLLNKLMQYQREEYSSIFNVSSTFSIKVESGWNW